MTINRMFFAVAALLVLNPFSLYAELSSKAKKADKLIGAGNVAGAVEIYKELTEKNAQKNPELVKEGREGMAKCLLFMSNEALKKSDFAEAKNKAEEILSSYADTPSSKGAHEALVAAITGLCDAMLGENRYDECLQECTSVKDKVPAGTPGLDRLNGHMGTCLYFQGKKALDGKDYKGAAVKLESVIKDYSGSEKAGDAKSDFADALVQLGNGCLERKEYAEALPYFQRVIKEFPDKSGAAAKAREGMSKIAEEIYKTADASLKEGKHEDALKKLEAALNASTDDAFSAKYKYAIGVCYRLSNQPDKAVQCYNDVVENYKTSPAIILGQTYHDLYLLYMSADNRQSALESIKQASSLDPSNSDYLFKQAELMSGLGMNENARKAYAKVLGMLEDELQKTYLNKEELQYKLGKAHLSLGNYTEAAVEFNKALSRDSSMDSARIGLAQAHFNDKNYNGAIMAYEELIKRLSSKFDKLQNSQTSNAPDTMKSIEELRGRIAYFHFQSGLSFEQLGLYEKALDECRLGLEGVSTQEAATVMKRVQALAVKQKTSSEQK